MSQVNFELYDKKLSKGTYELVDKAISKWFINVRKQNLLVEGHQIRRTQKKLKTYRTLEYPKDDYTIRKKAQYYLSKYFW